MSTPDTNSSIGASWPPIEASNNRLRGFYDLPVNDQAEAVNFANEFFYYQSVVTDHPSIDRLSIRLITDIRQLAILESLGVTIEAAIPLRSNPDQLLTYTAWNAPARQASEADLQRHWQLLTRTVITAEPQRANLPHGLTAQIIDEQVPDEARLALSPAFAELYANFGYNPDETAELVTNPANTIAYIADETGILSTAMAERATIKLTGQSDLELAEVTEAITRPDQRGNGLYTAISDHLVRHLLEHQTLALDALYGESNLAMVGVIRAARHNGRRFSFQDRRQLGINQPYFGILPQNFHVTDGQETRPYNDFALSYYPLGASA